MSMSRHAARQRPRASQELEQEFGRVEFHAAQLHEPRPQRPERAAPHRAFLAHPVAAAREHVEFALLGEQLDLDSLARPRPGDFEQSRFELSRCDQSRTAGKQSRTSCAAKQDNAFAAPPERSEGGAANACAPFSGMLALEKSTDS